MASLFHVVVLFVAWGVLSVVSQTTTTTTTTTTIKITSTTSSSTSLYQTTESDDSSTVRLNHGEDVQHRCSSDGNCPSSASLPHHSVSGFSAGASAAVQHLVAYSDIVVGMGIIGGSPYGCNILPDSGNTCSGFASMGPHAENKSIPWPLFVSKCNDYLSMRAKTGKVAPISNLVGKPVYLFSGTDDVWVYQSVMRAVALQFNTLNSSTKTVFNFSAAHSWVVDAETCSNPNIAVAPNNCCGYKNASTTCNAPPNAPNPIPTGCCGDCNSGDLKTVGWRPPINSCDYDMSGELLRWIYGDDAVVPRVSQRIINNSGLIQLNTTDFLPKPWTPKTALLDPLAFIYAPNKCRGNRAIACGIHVHYHPCGGSIRDVSTTYMLEIGLPAYAETNEFVIIYPQSAHVDNPATEGCFDWYGVSNADFDTRSGILLQFVMNVIKGLPEILTKR